MEIRIQEYEYYLLPAADLEKEIERLNKNLQDERSQHMYTLAEFNNYRRHIERRGIRLFMEVKDETILPLWDILNDLENTMNLPVNGGHSLMESMQIVHQKLLAYLVSQRIMPA